MYRAFVLAVAALGLTPGLGPFAACSSHSLILFPVTSSADSKVAVRSDPRFLYLFFHRTGCYTIFRLDFYAI